MTNHPFESFSLSGLDTSKVGNNKFVNYTLDDFRKDQNLSKKGVKNVLGTLGIETSDLNPVPKTSLLGRLDDFLLGTRKNYYLPKSITESLANAEKMKQEEISNDPLSIENLEKLKAFNLDLIREQDKISRKGRLADTGLELAMQRAQLPYLANFYKDISRTKQRELLEAEKIKQGLPNAVQSRLATADAGFATQAGAIKDQTDAATRMALAGTGIKFG